MPEPAAVYRPSPRPRPAGAPQRPAPARLHVVPEPATLQPETEAEPDTLLVDVPAGQNLADHAETAVQPTRLQGWWAKTATYWTPPAVFTDPPATLAELADYAKYAPWTHQTTGPLRTLGVGYYRGFGYPYTVLSRYREWFAQRPGRMVALASGIKIAALTAPGAWVVDHFIYPAVQFAGHLFL